MPASLLLDDALARQWVHATERERRTHRREVARGHGEKVPGLDMLAIGPQIEYPHSPDERVSVPTALRFWCLLAGIVDDLSQPGRRG